MRLGGPVFEKYETPDEWVRAVQKSGYTAARCPVNSDASDEEIRDYKEAAQENDIVIAEVGAWSNTLSPDPETRKQAVEKCKKSLALAESINAGCCVNISGSRGEKWDGPHPKNLTGETFDMIVESVRDIIDVVQPQKTFYTLETMPWMFPDSVDSYVELIHAVDRSGFKVHFDPANLINSPERYFNNKELIKEFVSKLGPHIRSCHGKDILIEERLTLHLNEVRPGVGVLDYGTYLKEISNLPDDVPLILEHLSDKEEYDAAAEYVRSIAKDKGIEL